MDKKQQKNNYITDIIAPGPRMWAIIPHKIIFIFSPIMKNDFTQML